MKNPWYKTQALASVADVLPDNDESLVVLEEAFETAVLAEDGYRRLGCAVWAFAAAVNRGMSTYAVHVLTRPGGLTDQIDGVEPEASRCYVLQMLIDAALPLGPDVYGPLRAALPCWRST
ncbi:MAG: hypothetical protein QM783_18770 [Phycisphaerales bacterium]